MTYEETVPVPTAAELRVIELTEGLERALKLMGHYAELLNMYDNGKRSIPLTVDAWLARLKATS